MLPNLVGRIRDESEVQYWCRKSYRGQPGSIRNQIAQECSTKFGRQNPRLKCGAMLGSKAYGVRWGSVGGRFAEKSLITSEEMMQHVL